MPPKPMNAQPTRATSQVTRTSALANIVQQAFDKSKERKCCLVCKPPPEYRLPNDLIERSYVNPHPDTGVLPRYHPNLCLKIPPPCPCLPNTLCSARCSPAFSLFTLCSVGVGRDQCPYCPLRDCGPDIDHCLTRVKVLHPNLMCRHEVRDWCGSPYNF